MTQDKKILGIDYGDIRIGIAIGFSESKVSSPYSIIENKNNKFVLEELKIILNQEEIEEIVIGIPYSLSSNKEKSDQLKKTKKFIEFLKGSLGIITKYKPIMILELNPSEVTYRSQEIINFIL